MQIKDKPNFSDKPKPVTFDKTDSVQAALDVMCDKNIGSIVITNTDETVAGIVTERDMMIRVLGEKRNPNETKLSEIMSSNVKVANESDNIVDWMHTMSNERFRHLPIVDHNGKLVCMMSQGDFVAFTWPDLYEQTKQNLKGRLGKYFQWGLILFAALTLALVALKL